jgi:hypothetical protein
MVGFAAMPTKRWKRLVTVACAIAVVGASAWLSALPRPNPLYLLQADSWLHGRLDLAAPAEDVAVFAGRFYVPYPPLPSVVLLPWVALLGVRHVPVRLLAAALAALAGWLAIRLFGRMGRARDHARWLTAALLFGTGYWLSVLWSDAVWFMAHVVAVVCVLAALDESFGPARGWRAGLFCGLSLLSRQLCSYSIVFVAATVWQRTSPKGRRAQIIQSLALVGAFAVCLLISLAFNAARFGHAFETGYAYIPLGEHLKPRVARYGLFHPAYLPFNFTYMFLQGPNFAFGGERLLQPLGMDAMGTSLTFASPFLFAAGWARGNRSLLVAGWVTVLLALTHALLYHNNGWVQVNTQRFSLDFIPVLLVLTALGTERLRESLWKAAVVWSIAWNVVALLIAPLCVRLLPAL